MKILTEVGGKIDEYSENFNKKLENIKKKDLIRSKEFNKWNWKTNKQTNKVEEMEQQTRWYRRMHQLSGK